MKTITTTEKTNNTKLIINTKKHNTMKTIITTAKMLTLAFVLTLTTVVNAQDKIYLGMRVPQMTTEHRAEIGAESSPLNARGQLIFNTDVKKFQYWNGTSWVEILDETQDVEVTSADGTVRVVKDGSRFDLSVNVEQIADSLANYIYNTILGDSIFQFIIDNLDVTNIGDIINEYLTNNFFNDFGDEIVNYITNNFTDELGDTIMNWFTNNITQEFVDSIMAKVNITSEDNTVTIVRNSPSDIDLSVNISVIGDSLVSNNTFVTNLGDELINNNTFITNLGDSLAYYFNETNLGDTILNYINNNYEDKNNVKQVTIAVVNGTIDTKNLTFYGTTSSSTSALKVVSIEPIFTNPTPELFVDSYLNVSATAQVAGNVAKWRVNIENNNFNANRKCTLESVVISYICVDEAPLTNATQGFIEKAGY
jgi:hypothetical protein